jgi:hypothetical protein
MRVAASAALALSVALSGYALAADNSDTSGPAQGTNVKPSTAPQNTSPDSTGNMSKGDTMTKAHPPAAEGDPGHAGMKGSKSGPAAK